MQRTERGVLALAGMVLVALMCAIAPARSQDIDIHTLACTPLKLTPLGWGDRGVDSYTITARTQPPDRVLTPGETYQIRYDITTDCIQNLNCADIKPHLLSMRAVVGSDRRLLQGAVHAKQGTVHVERFRCGTGATRFVTFTVPDPSTLMLGVETGVVDIAMGLCSPIARFNCAGHTIRVRNAPTGVWQVAAPELRRRTLTGNHVTGQPIPMSVRVTNLSGQHRYPGAPGSIVIKAATAGPTVPVARVGLPEVGDLRAVAVGVAVTPQTPGAFSYFACLTGLTNASGWPFPETCGPATTVHAVAPTAGAPAPAVQPQLQFDAVAAPVLGLHNSQAPAAQPPPPQGNLPQLVVPGQQRPGQQAGAPQGGGNGGMVCRGGEVRGPLCWCGIGRFPQALGNNVYQCR